jgi:hypothetical protein
VVRVATFFIADTLSFRWRSSSVHVQGTPSTVRK